MKPTKRTNLDIPPCQEIQIHYKRPVYDVAKKITSSQSAEIIFRDFADTERLDHKEFFWVMLLTNANQVIAVSEISIGGTSGTLVNIKEVAQLALLTNTSGVIIAHNHPSGKLNASESDLKITTKIKDSLAILDITLLDHIILTTESYTSFTDQGWL